MQKGLVMPKSTEQVLCFFVYKLPFSLSLSESYLFFRLLLSCCFEGVYTFFLLKNLRSAKVHFFLK